MRRVDFLVSSKALRAAIFAAAVRSGRPVDELARLVRASPSVLADPDARVSHSRVAAAWCTLALEVGDPALGLFAAQLLDAAAGDRLEPLLSHAPTLGAAMHTFTRYQKLYHTGNASRSELGSEAWTLTFALHADAAPSPELTDFVLGNWARRMRRAVARDLPIVATRLRRARPGDLAPYLAIFGANLQFGAAEDSLRLAPEAASFPVSGANPALRSILETQAQADLDNVDPDNAFLRDARVSLESALLDGVTSVEGLSRALAMSPRTLQRRLSSSGTSFQSLLDDVRHELAVAHLTRGQSVTDTAFMLGFSELSAFSRAFRRWTGRAPRSVARAHLAG